MGSECDDFVRRGVTNTKWINSDEDFLLRMWELLIRNISAGGFYASVDEKFLAAHMVGKQYGYQTTDEERTSLHALRFPLQLLLALSGRFSNNWKNIHDYYGDYREEVGCLLMDYYRILSSMGFSWSDPDLMMPILDGTDTRYLHKEETQ